MRFCIYYTAVFVKLYPLWIRQIEVRNYLRKNNWLFVR